MTSRKLVRHEFADLLKANLSDLLSVREDTDAAAVYSGQVASFGKARAAVVVSSAGSLPYPLAVKTFIGKHDLSVDVFVLYADSHNDWDEEDAEDLLDDISQKIMDTLAENQTGRYWSALDWDATSQTLPINIGGIDYRREQIILKPS